jgi:hypothetical protein
MPSKMKIIQENDGKPPSYDIPEHAKPLLREPTEVLEIKNVVRVFLLLMKLIYVPVQSRWHS